MRKLLMSLIICCVVSCNDNTPAEDRLSDKKEKKSIPKEKGVPDGWEWEQYERIYSNCVSSTMEKYSPTVTKKYCDCLIGTITDEFNYSEYQYIQKYRKIDEEKVKERFNERYYKMEKLFLKCEKLLKERE